MTEIRPLTELRPGMELLLGGDRVLRISAALADRFRSGDALRVVEQTGEVLHIPAAESRCAAAAVASAVRAFGLMGAVTDAQISRFYEDFAAHLDSAGVWAEIEAANLEDVKDARERGRSTTRLITDENLRRGMVDGLRGWIEAPTKRGQVLEVIEHRGWRVELVGAELGVVAFVFEGRPNVLADATGVLRGGNTVVFRIGRDALRTARAIMNRALRPALLGAGLPEGAVMLVDSVEHAAGWALFSDVRLALAVARGSGPAVATLGSLARQAGVPVSLHGTGGAWLLAAHSAEVDGFAAAVLHSLDRKVCNTLNVCCIVRSRAADLVPAFLRSLVEAGARRGQGFKLHVVEEDRSYVPRELFESTTLVRRAHGEVREARAECVNESALGLEWEWEETPELTLKVIDSVDHGVELFNRYSPQFIACLISEDADEHARFYRGVNAAFVGNGFTRWVDGQYALARPELGLSNWQHGRLFGRGGVLSGDSVFTVRTRAVQSDPRMGR
jgi:glutamate-5-semialdehyde dehydrogenase